MAPSASSCSRALRRSTSGSGLRFEAVPLDQEATEGTQVTFTCQVSSVADAMVTWLRDGNPVRTGPGLQQRRDGTRLILTMDRVTQLDSGTYGCRLTTPEGLSVASATWMLRVNRASRCPVFLSELQDCSVSEGQPFSLQVCVEGKPDPSVSWQLNGRPLPPRTRSSHVGGVAKLMVENASRHDGGVYVCVAENIHGRAESSARVQVKGMVQSQRSEVTTAGQAPRFIRRLSDLKVMDGSRVSMTVELSGEPPPLVMWLHDGQEVSESEDFHLLREENRYTLLIQEVFPEDTGAYSCRAWNQYGEDQTQARLTVEGLT